MRGTPEPEPIEHVFEAIAESCELSGLFAKADEQAQRELEADPEWSTKKWHHIHSLVEAFAVGIIRADPFHWGYKLPPNYEAVVNYIADRLQRHWPGEVVVEVSLIELERLFRWWAFENPLFTEWNKTAPGAPMVAVVTRYSSTPVRRDFIDLDALLRNAMISLRTMTRETERFDAKFKAEHPDLEI